MNQRQAKKNGKLSQEQIEKLESIGMVWEYADEKWEANYLEALRYFNEHGNLSVPREYISPSGIRLGAWLGQINRTYDGRQKGAAPLTQDQITRLEAIGMVWGNRKEGQWQKAYVQAERYYQCHGDLNIPLDHVAPDGTNLGKWITIQRSSRKNGNMPKQRIEQLDKIAMDWRLEDPWEHRYKLACQYQKEHGNLKIPAKYKTQDGIWLGNWLQRQKLLLKRGEVSGLTPGQVERLKDLVTGA